MDTTKGVEFIVVRDLYREVILEDEETGEKYPDIELVKTNHKTLWLCRHLMEISDIEPAYSDTGRKYKNRTQINYQGSVKTVMMSYEKVKEILTADISAKQRIGFHKPPH
jgi:hypothetical protein